MLRGRQGKCMGRRDPWEVHGKATVCTGGARGGKVSENPSENSAQELGPAEQRGLVQVEKREEYSRPRDIRIKGLMEPKGSAGAPLMALLGHEGHGAWCVPRKGATVVSLGLARKQQERRKSTKAACILLRPGLWPWPCQPTPPAPSKPSP